MYMYTHVHVRTRVYMYMYVHVCTWVEYMHMNIRVCVHGVHGYYGDRVKEKKESGRTEKVVRQVLAENCGLPHRCTT